MPLEDEKESSDAYLHIFTGDTVVIEKIKKERFCNALCLMVTFDQRLIGRKKTCLPFLSFIYLAQN